jgi:hypothetical protein
VRLREAADDLAATGQVHGALRVPNTAAPIKVTADLPAGLVRCAITVPAPRTGRGTTRVNWLARQLKAAPPGLCIEAVAAWQRGKGPVKTLGAVSADPKVLAGDAGHEPRAFILSLTSKAGAARGHGHGSFVKSVTDAIEKFYADVVQHIKPWTPAPPKAREDEAAPLDEPALQDDAPAVEARMAGDAADGAQPGPGLPRES